MTTYGIGEFRMRNGGKAVVEHDDGGNWLPLKGTIDGGVTRLWHSNGRYIFDEHEFDLEAPWEEPAPDPIDTEMQAWLAEVEAGVEGTTPGDWSNAGKNLIGVMVDDRARWSHVATVQYDEFHPEEFSANANHIANTNPERMAELISWLKSKGVMK